MMQITIASVQAFTERAVRGLTANRAKAEEWLAHNPIVVTALNPLIGYSQGAELVKEAAARGMTIHDIAVEKAKLGTLMMVDGNRPVTIEEIETALSNLRGLS
jgi:fumarate hydratase class II